VGFVVTKNNKGDHVRELKLLEEGTLKCWKKIRRVRELGLWTRNGEAGLVCLDKTKVKNDFDDDN